MTKSVEDATSKEIHDAFYLGAKADLEYWIPRNLSTNIGFYPYGSGQDDVTATNQMVSDWYQPKCGKPIKPEQFELFRFGKHISRLLGDILVVKPRYHAWLRRMVITRLRNRQTAL